MVMNSSGRSESHPRQWVNRSSPAYKRGRLNASLNPTHGGEWVDRSSPAYKRRRLNRLSESHPRHSGWIVQVRPTNDDG